VRRKPANTNHGNDEAFINTIHRGGANNYIKWMFKGVEDIYFM
jgi:hypothetical protein